MSLTEGASGERQIHPHGPHSHSWALPSARKTPVRNHLAGGGLCVCERVHTHVHAHVRVHTNVLFSCHLKFSLSKKYMHNSLKIE